MIRSAKPSDLAAVKQLLAANQLPADDLAPALEHFFIAEKEGKPVGIAGLEIYGAYGLLRSLVTDPVFRNEGIASQLIAALLDHAGKEGIREIYLLTETAPDYFRKKGFGTISREQVPEEIKQSTEFSHVCPSSAIVMRKPVNPFKKILFVCIENSNRSQMSQAFAKILAGDKIEAFSAGSRPSGKINPKAIAAMGELGYDLSDHQSKSLEEVKSFAPFDVVVTMGCGDACPWMPAKKFIDWQIPDPRHMDEKEFREVRDLIREKVGSLVKELVA